MKRPLSVDTFIRNSSKYGYGDPSMNPDPDGDDSDVDENEENEDGGMPGHAHNPHAELNMTCIHCETSFTYCEATGDDHCPFCHQNPESNLNNLEKLK